MASPVGVAALEVLFQSGILMLVNGRATLTPEALNIAKPHLEDKKVYVVVEVNPGDIKLRVHPIEEMPEHNQNDDFSANVSRIVRCYNPMYALPVILVSVTTPVTCVFVQKLPWAVPDTPVCDCCGAMECSNS